MFCSKCGNQINQGERFCSSCGNSIEVVESIQPKIEIPKPPVTKKPINKKVLIPVAVIASILVIGLIVLVAYLGATAPEREMKKALETNDYYTVITAYENLRNDGEYGLADDMIVDYINDAINGLNNNFSVSVDTITDDDEIYSEILWFLYETYGDMFVIVDQVGEFDENGLMDDFWDEEQYPDIAEALNSLQSMVESKYQYFEGLYELDPSFKDDDYYYMNALDSFAGVIEEDINYDAAQEKAKEVCNEYINSLIAKADEYIAMGDYSAAVELLNHTMLDEEELGIDVNLKAKFDEVLSTYAEQYVTKAEEEFKNGDVNAAIGNIEAAISIYPEGEYETKLEEYKLYLPLALYNEYNFLTYKYGEGGFDYYESIVGNDNIKYNNIIQIDSYVMDDGSDLAFTCEYNLAGKYDSVSGLMLMAKENQNQKLKTYFKAYGDGKLLYTSPSLKAGDLPENISFGVSGVQKLKIEFYIELSQYEYCSGEMYISDLMAKKNIPV